jgi:hypothetical protein
MTVNGWKFFQMCALLSAHLPQLMKDPVQAILDLAGEGQWWTSMGSKLPNLHLITLDKDV